MASSHAGALLFGILLVLLLLLVPPAAWAADASITLDGIDPDPVLAEADEIVSFTNDTDAVVRLIDDAGRWDSGDLAVGDRFTITFETPGTYGFSSQDGSISGTIEVQTPASASEGPTATEAAPSDTPSSDAPASETPVPTPAPAPSATPTAAPTTPPASDAPPAEGLASTGLPSAAMAWTAALSVLVGIVVLRRTAAR